MAGKRLTLDLHFGGDIHIEIRLHRPAQLICDAVRHAVVNRDILQRRFCGRRAFHVHHAATECCSDRETTGVDVVFHIIVGTLRQNDFGFDFTDDRHQFRQILIVVEYFDVVADTLVEDRSDQFCGVQRFFAAHPDNRLVVVMIRSERAVGDVHVMNFVTGILQQHHRAHHAELKIVRMAGDGKCSLAHDQCISTSQTPKPKR